MIKKFNVKKTRQLKTVNNILKIFYSKPDRKSDKDTKDYKEIIIVDFSLIGDMVMNIPFLQQIRVNCPGARISMVARWQSVEVLQGQGLIDEFIVFDGKTYLSTPGTIIKNSVAIHKILKKINQRKYDVAIEPKGDLRHTWFMHYIQSDRSISYNYTGGEYLITDSFVPKPDTRHLIDEKLDLLEMAGFDVDRDYNVPQFIKKSKKKIINEKIIGIHPGASSINKMYRHFGLIIDYLALMDIGIQIYVYVDPLDDAEISEGIIESIERNNISYKIVREKLDKYITSVAMCDLMICNDSSAGHIAAAYGIPAIVIFGAIKPETACPRGSRVISISYDCDCKPCTLEDCPDKTYECLEKISIESIYNALEEMIGKSESDISR